MATPAEQDRAAEEAWLIARVGAGDRSAFRELYSRYSPPLFSLLLRMMGDPRDAEELLQDSFVKIWTHAGAFELNRARPFTWAVTITRRTAIDRLRQRARTPRGRALDEMRELGDPAALAPVDTAMWREQSAQARAALAGLPAEQRAAVELALFDGLAQSEIATRLNQPLGTVKSWIRRGLLELRSNLDHP